MYSNNDKISNSQMVSIVILTMVGVGILTLPRGLVEEAGTDGWLVLILGALVAMAVSFVHGYIIKSFPGKGFFQILTLTLTKPIAYIVVAYTIAYLIGMTGYVTRIFATIVRTLLLPQTPPQLLTIPILLISFYLARGGIEVLGRVAEIIIVPLLVTVLVLFMITWRNAEISNLLPAFQASPFELIQSIPFALFAFLGFEVLLIFGGFIDKPTQSTRVGPIAIFIALLLYLTLNASVLGVLGAKQTENLVWPLLSTFKTIELPGAFIENVDILVMVIWVFAAFMTIAPLHLGATLLMKELAGGKDHGYYALLPLPFIAVLSLWDDSIGEVYESLGTFSDYTGYGVAILVPLGIFISILIRKKKKKKTAS